MMKLTTHQPNEREIVIRADGRLCEEAAEECRALLRALPRELAITLDLSGLESVDRAGLALLVELRSAGSRLRGGSLYINRLLQEGAS